MVIFRLDKKLDNAKHQNWSLNIEVKHKQKQTNDVLVLLASMVPIAPSVQMPSRPPKATAGARQAKNRKKVEDITYTAHK